MGRLGLRSTTVGQTAQHLLETRRITQPPIWLPVIARHPPGEITHRPLPANPPQASKRSTFKQKNKRLFHPQPMRYLEDDLRTAFFGDHPWELARPRQVLEQDGRNGRDCDWSRMRQKTVRLSGER